MLFDILPVLISAVLSALILNYFFIPPFHTFHISNTEDVLMFFIYLSVALVNAVLSFKIRKEEEKSRDKEEKENAIKKLKLKNADYIILNSLQDKGAGFGHDSNKITIFDKAENCFEFDLKSKKEVAADIINTISKKIHA